LKAALGDIARQGVTEIATATGLGRANPPEGNPEFATVAEVPMSSNERLKRADSGPTGVAYETPAIDVLR
jgi:DNA-binding phage protein